SISEAVADDDPRPAAQDLNMVVMVAGRSSADTRSPNGAVECVPLDQRAGARSAGSADEVAIEAVVERVVQDPEAGRTRTHTATSIRLAAVGELAVLDRDVRIGRIGYHSRACRLDAAVEQAPVEH